MMKAELNALLRPISWLIGRWESADGVGYFPTIKDFRYNDILEFQQCGGQPLLSYSGSSAHPEKGNPMHLESGFLRAREEEGQVSFMVAHNFGLSTLEEGSVTGNIIEIKSTHIGRMGGAKDPSVLEIKRVWTLVDEKTLTCRMWMATSNHKNLTEHLFATYTKTK